MNKLFFAIALTFVLAAGVTTVMTVQTPSAATGTGDCGGANC